MLVEALATGRSPREIGVEAGRRMVGQLPASADPVERLEINAARQGFEPRRVERQSSVDLVLDRCPYQSSALAAPEIVCQLHLGIAEGIAQASGGAVEVVRLVARDARRAGCRLILSRTAEPELGEESRRPR
jgi:hypothetical protein